MDAIRFAWDGRKARSNAKKHGVSFEETESVFYAEQALFLEDPRASGEEERFLLLGLSSTLRMLVVVHALRSEDVIRIISVRRATRPENQAYQSRLR